MLKDIEYQIASLVKEVYNLDIPVEQVLSTPDLKDFGVNSLNLFKLIVAMEAEYDIEIPVSVVFNTLTIQELAQYINQARKSSHLAIEPAPKRDYYPASSAQKRLYLLNQLEGITTAYNMPAFLEVTGNLNLEMFEAAFQALIKRHESLRTSFDLIAGEPVQIIHENVDFHIQYDELDQVQPMERDLKLKEQITGFVQPFDLSKAPLLRVKLIKFTDEQSLLMFDMSHIISDRASIRILTNEIFLLYSGHHLPGFRLQYKDFSEWQNKLLQSEWINKQEEYWMNRFSGPIPVLNLPMDYSRPPRRCFEGDVINIESSVKLTGELLKLTAETGASLFMVLLAVYNILLAKYSGQEDIIVGTPIEGRQHADLQNIIGMFVNTLALRNHPQRAKSFREFLEEVKKSTLEAFENQDYQFEELVSKLSITRDVSRNPLFDTMFTFHTYTGTIEVGDIIFKPYDVPDKTAQFDISLTAVEGKTQVVFSLEYCTKLFQRESMERFAKSYLDLIAMVTHHPDILLSDISIDTDLVAEKPFIPDIDFGF